MYFLSRDMFSKPVSKVLMTHDSNCILNSLVYKPPNFLLLKNHNINANIKTEYIKTELQKMTETEASSYHVTMTH